MSAELSEQYRTGPGTATVDLPDRATGLLLVCRRPA